jgi:hypothetical protein
MGEGWGRGGDVLEAFSLRRARGVWVRLLRAVVVRAMGEGRRALVVVFRRARADIVAVVWWL